VSNVRQILEERLKKKGIPVRDIRAREVKDALVDAKDLKLVVRKYEASGGVEVFLSFEDILHDKIVALLRLRFPCKTFIKEIKGAALIREIHVYGRQIPVGEKGGGGKQHFGLGTKLMIEAEKLSIESGYNKIAVISGIGTREYYRKKGYVLEGSYMVKSL
jgi:elongator complex protein 3